MGRASGPSATLCVRARISYTLVNESSRLCAAATDISVSRCHCPLELIVGYHHDTALSHYRLTHGRSASPVWVAFFLPIPGRGPTTFSQEARRSPNCTSDEKGERTVYVPRRCDLMARPADTSEIRVLQCRRTKPYEHGPSSVPMCPTRAPREPPSASPPLPCGAQPPKAPLKLCVWLGPPPWKILHRLQRSISTCAGPPIGATFAAIWSSR